MRYTEPPGMTPYVALHRAIGVLLAVGATAFLLLYASEWWQVGVVRQPSVLASYSFGSEAMLSHGGWHYRTAATYSGVCLAEALWFALALALLGGSLFKSSIRLLKLGALTVLAPFALRIALSVLS